MLGQLKRRYSARATARRNQIQIDASEQLALAAAEDFQEENFEEQNYAERSTVVSTHRASVQCSACSTRFSVPDEFADVDEELRFHCPRCNHIFCAQVLRHAQSEVKPEPESQVLDFQTGMEVNIPETPSAVADEEETFVSITEGVEILKQHAKPSETNQSSFDFSAASSQDTTAPKAEPNQIQMPFMFDLQTKKVREVKESQIRNFISNMSLRQRVAVKNVEPEPRVLGPRTSVEQADLQITTHHYGQWSLSKSIKRCLPFTVPAAALLAVLSVVTLVTLNSKEIQSGFQSVLYPGVQRPAPVGLMIDDLSSQKVLLDSGEEMTLISGKIINNTTRGLKDIRLEVLGFDSSGQLLTSLKTGLGKTLTDSKVKALSADAIKKIQERGDKKVVRPGEEKNFELALFPSELEDLSYYNSRIYSVRYN